MERRIKQNIAESCNNTKQNSQLLKKNWPFRERNSSAEPLAHQGEWVPRSTCPDGLALALIDILIKRNKIRNT